MKIKQYKEEVVWLLENCGKIQKSAMQEEQISFWSNLITISGISSGRKEENKKRRILTIIGEPFSVYTKTNLFDQMPDGRSVILLTSNIQSGHQESMYSKHPLIQWFDVLYIPPLLIGTQLDVLEKVTLIVENKLPIWSKVLFMKNKVANVFSDIPTRIKKQMPHVNSYLLSEFNYELLVDEYIITTENKKNTERIPTALPKDIVTKLHLNDEQEIEKRTALIDEAVARMINTYWLQNRPSIEQWLPILLMEVTEILNIRKQKTESKVIIEKLTLWGERLTHVT